MTDTLTFIASLLFLIGILMVLASVIPQLQKQFPRLMGHGFLVSFVSIIMAVVVAFVAT